MTPPKFLKPFIVPLLGIAFFGLLGYWMYTVAEKQSASRIQESQSFGDCGPPPSIDEDGVAACVKTYIREQSDDPFKLTIVPVTEVKEWTQKKCWIQNVGHILETSAGQVPQSKVYLIRDDKVISTQ